MRVIAGECRSMPLKAPKGMDVRPTTDRIKETLFNMLQTRVPGAVCADIFAGSGAIGIEALSRGSLHCYFVDNSREAGKCILDNLKSTKLIDRSTLYNMDVVAGIGSIKQKCDLIFVDPPYDSYLETAALSALAGSRAVDEDTLIVIELPLDREVDAKAFGFAVKRIKEYKNNKHIFLCKE